MRWLPNPFTSTPSRFGTLVGAVLIGTASLAAPAHAADDWFRHGAARPADSAPAGGQDYGQPTPPQNFTPPGPAMQGNNNQRQSDFPADQMQDWVVASARAARSRAMLHLSEKQLNDAIRDVQFTFEQSREYRDASLAEKQAYDAYTIERQKALKSVLSDPKYQVAMQLRDDLGDKLAQVRAMARNGPVPREDVLAMASQKLQYSSEAHEMEREALDKDAAVGDARQKMVQASARAADLRAQFDISLRMNPQIAQARRNLDQARVELITAEAYASASAAANAIATDYSYYRHRWDGLASPVYGGYGPYTSVVGQ